MLFRAAPLRQNGRKGVGAMYQKKGGDEIRCPLEYGLKVFGGKWKPRIICVLNTRETLRYGELRTEMSNITDAVLASALKELIRDGIVARKSYDEIPPRVEYSLTERGRSVVPILLEICRWSGGYARSDAAEGAAQCRRCDHRQAAGESV